MAPAARLLTVVIAVAALASCQAALPAATPRQAGEAKWGQIMALATKAADNDGFGSTMALAVVKPKAGGRAFWLAGRGAAKSSGFTGVTQGALTNIGVDSVNSPDPKATADNRLDDAERHLMRAAAAAGATIQYMVSSRPTCPTCWAAIKAAGLNNIDYYVTKAGGFADFTLKTDANFFFKQVPYESHEIRFSRLLARKGNVRAGAALTAPAA